MAKRVRRVKKKSRQQKANNNVVQETADTMDVSSEDTSKGKTSGDEFQQEYAYVMKDLRLVLILAAALFLLLIALNLFLQ